MATKWARRGGEEEMDPRNRMVPQAITPHENQSRRRKSKLGGMFGGRKGGEKMMAVSGGKTREQRVMELTSRMLHQHYCENDVEAIIAQMDDAIHWVGAAEQEYAVGLESVASIFRQFTGQVPKCNIYDEVYHVLEIAPGAYLCTGQAWIATDASTQISLRVHQRITTVFRWGEGAPSCCHIHISNPYQEMTQGDQGFPVKMAWESYRYLQEQIEKQKEQIQAQTEILLRMSYEDTLTGVYNRNKFNQVMEPAWSENKTRLGWPILISMASRGSTTARDTAWGIDSSAARRNSCGRFSKKRPTVQVGTSLWW